MAWLEAQAARFRWAGAAAVSVLFLAPLVYLVLGAIREPGIARPEGLGLLPGDPSLGAFGRAFESVDLGRQLLNSAIVVAVAVPLTIVVASWAGFAMTRLPDRQRRLLIGACLVALMVPGSALWVPRFVLFRELSLIDTYVPLVAPALMGTTPFYVLLYYWSFRRLPGELVDAARLQGLGPLAIWRRVAAPLVRPTTLAVGMLAFIVYWGNFIDPLLYLTSPEKFTLPLGLNALRALTATDFPAVLAASLIATVPPLLAFALVQGRFLRGTRMAGWLGR